MAAAQTKEHEEDKHTGMQEKNKKRKKRKEKRNDKYFVGSKPQKQARKSYSRRLHSNKSFRLCYKTKPRPDLVLVLYTRTYSKYISARFSDLHLKFIENSNSDTIAMR